MNNNNARAITRCQIRRGAHTGDTYERPTHIMSCFFFFSFDFVAVESLVGTGFLNRGYKPFGAEEMKPTQIFNDDTMTAGAHTWRVARVNEESKTTMPL